MLFLIGEVPLYPCGAPGRLPLRLSRSRNLPGTSFVKESKVMGLYSLTYPCGTPWRLPSRRPLSRPGTSFGNEFRERVSRQHPPALVLQGYLTHKKTHPPLGLL